ncbi:MAG: class I SAM-dependent methyltransferase [Myxococcota bacterium]
MSRFSADFFHNVYRETAPWDVGKAQPGMTALLDEVPPEGPVLDVGCGTGDLVLEVARRGLHVVGIDIVEKAIAEARTRAGQLPDLLPRVQFRVGDALQPSLLPDRFASVVDCGFFHVLESHVRDRFVDELTRTLLPGGRYYLLAFAVEFPMPNTPLKVTEEELRARFGADRGWSVVVVRAAQFQSRVQPVPAVAAVIQRS